MKLLNEITPIEKDFGKWYSDVVIKGNMIKHGASQGSMIFKPISYGIWENIQKELNKIFKKTLNAQNVKLPLLIPLSYIQKEQAHIKGFAPEIAMITKVGEKKLDEPLVVRPTSEVLFTEFFAEEISSYKDLPLIFNQWANVLRWEKKTSPFLRNREFMWQEGHTAHASIKEAQSFSLKVIKTYEKFLKNYLAIPTIVGKKTDKEKFAGAVTTYTVEAMMKDGKALQSATSHYLGQNFSKPFNAKFKNKFNEQEFAYQTSWGASTRLIGAIIMSHGDNRGIIIPPKIALNQVDILEISGNKNPEIKNVSQIIEKQLKQKFSFRIDDSNKSIGYKASQSEIEGTPLRIEIGPRDLIHNKVTIVRRDTLKKELVKIDQVKKRVGELLREIQKNLYLNAKKRLAQNLIRVNSYEEMKLQLKENKFIIASFAGDSQDEEKIKKETGATARCAPISFENKEGVCIITGTKTNKILIFAKAY